MDKLQYKPINEFRNFLQKINTERKKNFCKTNSVNIGYDKFGYKFITIDDIKISIDSWALDADIIYVSHAHMDHIPILSEQIKRKLEEGMISKHFFCSKITKEISERRTNGRFKIPENSWLLGKDLKKESSIDFRGVKFSLILNGHTPGSTSLLIEGSKKILYTSDFTTKDREFLGNPDIIKGLKPIKCDTLIMECTFGIPRFIFPSYSSMQAELMKYIETSLTQDIPVILLAYSFGKSQNVLKCLRDSYNIILDKDIAKNVKILEKNGVEFPLWKPYGKFNKRQLIKLKNYVLIIPPYSIFKEPYKSLIRSGAKVVLLSGNVLNDSYRKKFPADKYIPFSDHCDFKELQQFAERCNPKNIYLEHGKIEEFSYHISNILNNERVFYIL